MDYRTALTNVAAEYTKSPIEFTVECDFQARLTESLRNRLRSKNALHANFADDHIRYTGDSANYKESYVDHFLHKTENSVDSFSRVHTEVAPYESLISEGESREHIDVVVFSETVENPINWRGGSQRHHWDDYDAAFEIKYIKNKNKFPASIDDTDISNTPIEEVRRLIDLEEDGIASDITELERLPEKAEQYLVIVSNHDYLYRGPIDDFDRRKQQRYRSLGDAAIAELQSRVEDTQILYAHPTGYQWLSGNRIQNPARPDKWESA